jgi:hypothetical protein
MRRLRAGTLGKKNRTISCRAGRDGVLFFRKAHNPGWRFSRATRDQDFGVRQRERLVTAQVELRNGAEPHDLILRREAKLHVSKDGPARRLVCAPWTVLRGPLPPAKGASG